MKHSKNQLAIYDWVENGSGNLVIDAKAGSGKSSTILHAATKMRGVYCILSI